MGQIYLPIQRNWSGGRARMRSLPLRSRVLVMARVFVIGVVQHCRALRTQVCWSFLQGVWLLKSLWRQPRIFSYPVKLLGMRGWMWCQGLRGRLFEPPSHSGGCSAVLTRRQRVLLSVLAGVFCGVGRRG